MFVFLGVYIVVCDSSFPFWWFVYYFGCHIGSTPIKDKVVIDSARCILNSAIPLYASSQKGTTVGNWFEARKPILRKMYSIANQNSVMSIFLSKARLTGACGWTEDISLSIPSWECLKCYSTFKTFSWEGNEYWSTISLDFNHRNISPFPNLIDLIDNF